MLNNAIKVARVLILKKKANFRGKSSTFVGVKRDTLLYI